jgi:hypothetical protein
MNYLNALANYISGHLNPDYPIYIQDNELEREIPCLVIEGAYEDTPNMPCHYELEGNIKLITHGKDANNPLVNDLNSLLITGDFLVSGDGFKTKGFRYRGGSWSNEGDLGVKDTVFKAWIYNTGSPLI